jgi:hypothetical protein
MYSPCQTLEACRPAVKLRGEGATASRAHARVRDTHQAAAFASTLISRRSRLSSSRSAVVTPSLRRPSSSAACFTHWRIALAGGLELARQLVDMAPCARQLDDPSPVFRRVWWMGSRHWGTSFFLSPQHRLRNWVKSKQASKPTVKQHLAAIRQLFDYLTTGRILEVNPAASVRGPKYAVKRGKPPVLSAEEARKLLDSIESDTLIGLRNRALGRS